MNSTPASDAARYSGGRADCHTLLRTAVFFVPVQRVLILFGAGVLTAVNAVGHGVPGTVQRGSAQGTSRLFVGRTGALHRLFFIHAAHT